MAHAIFMDEERKRELKRTFKADQKATARSSMVLSEDELNGLLDLLDERIPEEGCDHTLRLTREWARARGVDPAALAASLEQFGGYCDCEVLANVEPDPECPVQEGTPGEGTYEWSLEGSELTLTDVEDTCRDRAFVLTAQSWARTE